MKIQLSDHFTFKRLIQFVIPSIMMMIFTSIYGVVDGFFVSNFVGKIPFAAINLIMPVPMMLGAIGFMLGAGGNALVAMTLGEGKREKANRIFSFLVYTGIVLGCLLAVIGVAIIEPVAIMLGAEGEMISMCVTYARIILLAMPAFMLQNMFQSFLITAEKPTLGLIITVVAGVTNMVLDALFMAVFHWGIAGAAFATALSQCVGGIIPAIYFARRNSSLLKLTKTEFDGSALFKASTNGSSELKNIFNKSIIFVMAAGVVLTIAAIVLASPLSKLFVGYDAELYGMTLHAFKVYSLSFLCCGFGIFGSSLFTALNNGIVSALISFLRTIVFQVAAIMIMPAIWGLEGIWYSVVTAEVLATIVSLSFIVKYKKKYKY